MVQPTDGPPWRPASLRALLILTTVEGLLAVGSIFWTRSMDRNAWLLGYSSARIGAGLGLLAIVVAAALAMVRSFRDPDWVRRILTSLDRGVASREQRLLAITYGLFLVALLGAYAIFLFQGRYVQAQLSFLRAVVDRSFWGMLWLVLLPLQLLALLTSWYPDRLGKAVSGNGGGLRLILLAVLTAASLQWATLAFQADWLYRIPGWFWHYSPKKLTLSDGFLVATVMLALVVAWTVMRRPKWHARNVILCIGLLFVMQAGFGFAEGEGFESLRQKYVNTRLSDEMRLACEYRAGPLESVRSYEVTHRESHWLATKPPGLFAFYVAFRDISASLFPVVAVSSNRCIEIVSVAMAFVAPALAAAIVVPITVTQRILWPLDDAFVPALLYACVPSVLLMPLIPDQFLFPLLFMIAATLLTKAIVDRSILFGVLSGACLYLCVFVSFSLLPVLALGCLWFLAEIFWGDLDRHAKLVFSAIGMGIGAAATWLALAMIANYNPIVRLVAALASHRGNMKITMTLGSVLSYARVNSMEFGLWNGLPLIVLALIGIAGGVAFFVRRRGGARAALSAAYGASILGLLVGGQTQGEVGRLWIFLLPLACLFAAPTASQLLGDRPRSVMLVMALELVTSCLMFLFMDFR